MLADTFLAPGLAQLQVDVPEPPEGVDPAVEDLTRRVARTLLENRTFRRHCHEIGALVEQRHDRAQGIVGLACLPP